MNKSDIEQQLKILFECWVEEKEKENSIKKIRYAGPKLEKEEYLAILDSLFNDWWSGGKFTYETEQKLASISSRNHGLLTNSGSSANLLLMSAAKELYFNDGDKILTLSCGFPTTVNPIIQNNLIPVFTDIDLDTLNISPRIVEEALNNDPSIKGIFVAHTLGFTHDIDSILDIARKKNVHVFFDCCDAYCTTYKGSPLQSYGKASTFSFYVAHHVTMGEGGGIVTNDEELHLTMRGFRNWGRYCASPNCCVRSVNPNAFCPSTKLTKNSALPADYMVNYQYEWLGYNLKPLEMQAAILNKQLDKIQRFNEIRRKNYKILYDFFKNQSIDFKTWKIDDEVSPFSFPFIIPENIKFNRKHLINHLQQNNIECRLLFGGNLMKHPAYSNKKHLWESFQSIHKNSDIILERFMMLGVSQINTEQHMYNIVTVLDEFLRKWK